MSYEHDWRRFRPKTASGLVGILTARTDADTGEITMSSANHPVETGDTVDVSWAGGSRTDMTVGTVSGSTVPIDGGSGDDLPATSTPVVVVVQPVVVPTCSNILSLSPYAYWCPIDADSITLYGTSPTQRITTWADQTANGHDLQKEASFAGGATLNGLSSEQLNGLNGVSTISGSNRVDFGEVLSQPYTIAAAMRIEQTDTFQRNYIDGFSSPNRATIYKQSATKQLMMYAGTNVPLGLTLNDQTTLAIIAVFNGASSFANVNGVDSSTGDAGAAGLGGVIVGAKYDHASIGPATFGEIAVFDRELDSSEIASLSSMLNAKWAVY